MSANLKEISEQTAREKLNAVGLKKLPAKEQETFIKTLADILAKKPRAKPQSRIGWFTRSIAGLVRSRQQITRIIGESTEDLDLKERQLLAECKERITAQALTNARKEAAKVLHQFILELPSFPELTPNIQAIWKKDIEEELTTDILSSEGDDRLRAEKISLLLEKYQNKIQFRSTDARFEYGNITLSDIGANILNRIRNFLNTPTTQGALTGAATGAMAALPLGPYGAVSGALVGAYVGYKNPAISKVWGPFKYIVEEVQDIWQKQKSHGDRIFRGLAIGIAIAVVIGGLALTPAGWGIFAVVALGFIGSIFVAAVAKGAKSISKWVSEKVYGIADSDRYEPSGNLKQLFRKEDAGFISNYFIQEIRAMQLLVEEKIKQANSVRDANDPEVRNLAKLEETWNEINKETATKELVIKAWQECARYIYDLKRKKYEITVEAPTEPQKNSPEQNNRNKKDNSPNKKVLSFSKREHTKEQIKKEIATLVEVDNKIRNQPHR
jgi:hypothetical protein